MTDGYDDRVSEPGPEPIAADQESSDPSGADPKQGSRSAAAAAASDAAPTTAPTTTEAATTARYRVRRAPRFRAFLTTGALAGFVLGVLVDRLGPAAERVEAASSLAFLGLVGALLGVLVAAVVAVLVERRG